MTKTIEYLKHLNVLLISVFPIVKIYYAMLILEFQEHNVLLQVDVKAALLVIMPK
jgi:hypothetical protein